MIRQHQAPSTKHQASGSSSRGCQRSDGRVTCRLSRVSGFSLVELIIALAILSVGIVGAMRVFPVGLRASRRAELNSRAVMAAQRALESLKLKPGSDLVDGETTEQDGGFEVITKLSPVEGVHLADLTRLKAAEVTVRWVQDGRSHQLTFVTYVRRDTS